MLIKSGTTRQGSRTHSQADSLRMSNRKTVTSAASLEFDMSQGADISLFCQMLQVSSEGL